MSSARLVRNASASVLQVLISAATLFLTYRLLVQHFSIEQIGLWALIIGSTAVARLAEFGLGAGVLRFVAGDIGQGRRESAARTVGMSAACVLLAVGVAALVAYPIVLPLLHEATPPGLEDAVRVLLTCALVSIVLGAVGNVFLGTVDGCQRLDIRAGIQVGGNLVQLIGTYAAAATGDLANLGYVQIAQSIFLLLGGAIFSAALIGARPRDYFGFDGPRLRQLAGYGGALQLSAIAQLLFEPLTKVLLTAFGGLALTGYFDVANRLVLQLRNIVIAGYAALVPHVAARVDGADVDPAEMRSIYLRSLSLLLYVLIPFFTCVAAAMPLILTLWIGPFDRVLLAIALLQLAAWSINSINPPAYFLFIAIGKVRQPILSHVVIGAITVVAGSALGYALGGTGVLAAAATALMAGSLYLIAAFHRQYHVRTAGLLDWRRFVQLVLGGAALLSSVVVAARMPGYRPDWAALIMPPLLIGGLSLLFMVLDPFGRQIFRWARGALAS